MAIADLKRCIDCKQSKPVSEFNLNQWLCRPCQSERYRKWRTENHEYHAERNRKWGQANKGLIAARNKLFRERNPEKIAARKREYHAKNAGYVRAKVEAWRKANPDKRRAQIEKRRTLKCGLPCDWTDADIRFGLDFWSNACAACRTPFGLIATPQWDHWIPIANPNCPGTIITNMVPLCLFCNSTKGERPAAKWLKERFNGTADKILRRVAKYFESARFRKD